MPTPSTPLVPITVASIYNKAALPSRMAKCTPDTATAILNLVDDLRSLGHDLRLSDLFRSYDMQRRRRILKPGESLAISHSGEIRMKNWLGQTKALIIMCLAVAVLVPTVPVLITASISISDT